MKSNTNHGSSLKTARRHLVTAAFLLCAICTTSANAGGSTADTRTRTGTGADAKTVKPKKAHHSTSKRRARSAYGASPTQPASLEPADPSPNATAPDAATTEPASATTK